MFLFSGTGWLVFLIFPTATPRPRVCVTTLALNPAWISWVLSFTGDCGVWSWKTWVQALPLPLMRLGNLGKSLPTSAAPGQEFGDTCVGQVAGRLNKWDTRQVFMFYTFTRFRRWCLGRMFLTVFKGSFIPWVEWLRFFSSGYCLFGKGEQLDVISEKEGGDTERIPLLSPQKKAMIGQNH